MGTYRICLEREKQSSCKPCPLTYTRQAFLSLLINTMNVFITYILGFRYWEQQICPVYGIIHLLVINHLYSSSHFTFTFLPESSNLKNRLLTGYFNEEKEGETRENGAYWTMRGNGVADRSTEGTSDSWTGSKVGKKASFSILLKIGSIKRNYWRIFLTGTVWSI